MNVSDILSINQSGLDGLQNNLDVIANNVSNVSTVGYKNRDTSFGEALENSITQRDANYDTNLQSKLGMAAGMTTHQQSINFTQGSLKSTTSPYDLAIEGNGFFGVRDANGQLYLTRDGDFHRDAAGSIVDGNGYKLDIQTTVPESQWPQGKISVNSAGQISIADNGQSTQVGTVTLYEPSNTEDLEDVGNNLYQLTGGNLLSSANGAINLGSIKQYYLEDSTVDLGDSISNLILTQRAYELNARSLETTDDILGTINQFTS
ncbi:flagellar hook-basal body protein [Liquorilactobacillus vini]|uniref:Flagellar basal-body rod protein n=1 Tax=Liquorilactobacillus vini DSM 20605 TaxID=1133569 RepID=A0A0A7RGZ6_9LACO|nr:flagellar hook-basal body protein [Liquorilactobacillus vini]AJA34485.1 flagellar basal-body rod protein FlgG [Liquorilactobacillus vini DSM 20605]KRM88630.1 flagellar basal-body rod protein [Liquorilactobacillus vini DSM 20605]